MYRIATLNQIPQPGLDILAAGYNLVETVQEADAALVRSRDMRTMELPQGFLAAARVGVGVNNLPLENWVKKGIVAFNAPGGNANAVKEMVFCALVAALRNYRRSVAWGEQLTGDVAAAMEAGKDQFVGHEIKGKILGVIGMGNVGSNVANLGMEYNMRVIGYDPYIATKSAFHLRPEVEVTDDWNAVIQTADVLTLHVPATKENEKLISRETIAHMKDGVIVINYSRDKIVDEEAMVEALKSGHVALYLTDFINSTIQNQPNVVASPHIGGSTRESEANCACMVAHQLKDYLENGNITNSVNYPELHLGVRQSATRVVALGTEGTELARKAVEELCRQGCTITNMKSAEANGAAAFGADTEGTVDADALQKACGAVRVRVL